MIVDQQGADVTPKIRVCVAIPSGDFVPMGFAYDLTQLVAATSINNPHIDIRMSNIQGTIISASRRELVKMAQKGGCDWILWLDSDMRFPRHALVRLLSHNKPIVAANYCTRREPLRPVTFADDTDAETRVYSEVGATDLQEVASTGMGCMLTHISIFDRLDGVGKPWFHFGWNTGQGHLVGEDVWFCRRVRDELGEKIYLDHGLTHSVKHVGIREYSMADALVARDMALAAGEPLADPLDLGTGPASETGAPRPAEGPADSGTP